MAFMTRSSRYLLTLTALLLLYWLLCRFGLQLRVRYAGLVPLWPASGLAVALFWLNARRWWPVVLFGELLTGLSLDQPLLTGLGGGLSHSLEAWLAVSLLRRCNTDLNLASIREVGYFLALGALLPATVGGLLGVTGLQLLGQLPPGELWSGLLAWTLGDAVGVLLLAPGIVLWAPRPPSARRWRPRDSLPVLATLLVGAGLLLLEPTRAGQLLFLLFPLVIWAAFQERLGGVVLVNLLCALLVVALHPGREAGAFRGVVDTSFIAISAITGYLLCAALAELRLRRRRLLGLQKRTLATLQSIADGVICTDTGGRVNFINAAAARLTGWSAQAAANQPVQRVLPYPHGRHPIQRCLMGEPLSVPSWQLTNRGGGRWVVQDSVSLLHGDDGTLGAVMIFRDTTEERRLQDALRYTAEHDGLTGLVNRETFERKLRVYLDANAPPRGAILYLDLDQFKIINDTYGHELGDYLLRDLSLLLHRAMAPHLIARLGGDEFGILIHNTNSTGAMELAERLRTTVLGYRCRWEDRDFHVGASIGVTLLGTGDRLAAVLSRADIACYMAKEQGHNRIHLYNSGDADIARRHDEMHMIGELQAALIHNRLCLYGQPICRIDGVDQPDLVEVLLRLRDGERLLSPGVFLPAAERFGLMATVDHWVLEAVFRLLHAGSLRAAQLTVNLAGSTVSDPRFPETVEALLARFPVDPERLCFEVTESVAIRRLSLAVQTMRRLASRGFRFALDDFGSGVASFGYLQELPVNYVKLDGRFVKHLAEDEANHIIIDSLARLARCRKIECIAEWVESATVVPKLVALGVHYGQGFHLGRPAPLEQLAPG